MYLEKVVEFYTQSISSFGLVFRHFKATYYGFAISLCLSILVIWVFLTSLLLRFYVLWGFSLFILIVGITTYLFFRFNDCAKKVILKEYELQPNGFLWKTNEFEELQINRLKGYLLENDLYCEKKLKHLVDLLYKEAERRKVPNFIGPSVFLAFLVPLWVQVIGVAYKQVTTLPGAIASMVTLALLITVVISLFGLIKNTYVDAKDTFFIDESQKMKKLALVLEDLILGLPTTGI